MSDYIVTILNDNNTTCDIIVTLVYDDKNTNYKLLVVCDAGECYYSEGKTYRELIKFKKKIILAKTICRKKLIITTKEKDDKIVLYRS